MEIPTLQTAIILRLLRSFKRCYNKKQRELSLNRLVQSEYGRTFQKAQCPESEIDAKALAVQRPATLQRTANKESQGGERDKFSLRRQQEKEEGGKNRKAYSSLRKFVIILGLSMSIITNVKIELSLNHLVQSEYGRTFQKAQCPESEIDAKALSCF